MIRNVFVFALTTFALCTSAFAQSSLLVKVPQQFSSCGNFVTVDHRLAGGAPDSIFFIDSKRSPSFQVNKSCIENVILDVPAGYQIALTGVTFFGLQQTANTANSITAEARLNNGPSTIQKATVKLAQGSINKTFLAKNAGTFTNCNQDSTLTSQVTVGQASATVTLVNQARYAFKLRKCN